MNTKILNLRRIKIKNPEDFNNKSADLIMTLQELIDLRDKVDSVTVLSPMYLNDLDLKGDDLKNFSHIKEVMNDVSVANNQLDSLKFLPDIIWGSLFCNDNNICTLEGMPKYILEGFNYQNNPIEDELDKAQTEARLG